MKHEMERGLGSFCEIPGFALKVALGCYLSTAGSPQARISTDFSTRHVTILCDDLAP